MSNIIVNQMSNSELIGGNAESMELRNSVSFSKLIYGSCVNI